MAERLQPEEFFRDRYGVSAGALHVHFYDLGPGRGLRIVGLERPTP